MKQVCKMMDMLVRAASRKGRKKIIIKSSVVYIVYKRPYAKNRTED